MDCAEVEYWNLDGVGHLRVVLDKFPTWAIEADIMAGAGGPIIAETRVLPRQTLEFKFGSGTWRLGSKSGRGPDFEEPSPPAGQRWSRLPADIPTGGVPARLLRAINPGQLLDLARQHAREETEQDTARAAVFEDRDPALAEYLRQMATHSAPLTRPSQRPGRRGNGIAFYLDWAVRFVEKVDQGSRSPIADLADAGQGMDRDYIRDVINDARHRHGLLTKPGPGRVGGALTPKALQLLRERSTKKEDT